jgi:hypothetical protein
MEAILRWTSLLAWLQGTVGTSAVQVSGGPNSNWPLTGVGASYQPSYRRQGITITNLSSTATIYIGVSSSVSSSFYIHYLAPGDDYPIACDGSVPVWIIASAASTPFGLAEWQ